MKRRMDRWRRRCGFDANDLRRDVDRTQWRIGLVLLMLFLSVTPPLTVDVAEHVYDSGKRIERREAAAWRRVNATVVQVGAQRSGQRVTVAWTGPDGTRRTGGFTTWMRVRVGDQIPAWAGRGTVTDTPPVQHWQTVLTTAVMSTGAVLGVGLVPFGLYMLARHRCDRHRDRLWDAAWAQLGNHRIGP